MTCPNGGWLRGGIARCIACAKLSRDNGGAILLSPERPRIFWRRLAQAWPLLLPFALIVAIQHRQVYHALLPCQASKLACRRLAWRAKKRRGAAHPCSTHSSRLSANAGHQRPWPRERACARAHMAQLRKNITIIAHLVMAFLAGS